MAAAGQRGQRLARAVLSGRLERRIPALPLLSREQGSTQSCSVAQLPAVSEAVAGQGAGVGERDERQRLRGEAGAGNQGAHEVRSVNSSQSRAHAQPQPLPQFQTQPFSQPRQPTPSNAASHLLCSHAHPEHRLWRPPHGASVDSSGELAYFNPRSTGSLVFRRGLTGLGWEEAEARRGRREGGPTRVGWSYQQVRELSAAKVSGSDVKVGNVIERKGKMLEVVKTQHTQQGRGGATIQVELRDIHSGLKSTEKLRTAEPIEVVFVDAKPFSFLYSEGDVAHLMDPETYDQLAMPKSMLGDVAKLLKEGMQVHVKYFNGEPLMASLPARVTVKVVEAEPHVKGNTATPSYKKVTVEGGLTVGVPPFVVEGDDIVVQTSDMTYVTRA